MKRRKNRKEKALAAANKRAYRGLAIGGAVGLALIGIALSVAPMITREEIVSAVKAQALYRTLPASTGDTVPEGPPPAASTSLGGSLMKTGTGSAAVAQNKPGYLPIGFDKLSTFPFIVTYGMVDEKKAGSDASLDAMRQIPEEVRALSEKEVSLTGFMLPMRFEGKVTTEFLLLKNQGMCCYGVPPKITEWVNVQMTGKGVEAIMDQPVTVCGTFHVGALRENGDLVGIYRLDGDKLKVAGD